MQVISEASLVSIADNDCRYIQDSAPANLSFCSVAHESRYEWAVRRFDLGGKSVLDFGCGSGYGTAILGRQGRALGIDKSPTAIQYASAKYANPQVSFVAADACSPELLEPQRFDCIFSFDVIEHVERYFAYIENAVRLLMPGGVFVVGCPNRLETFNWNQEWNPYHFQEFSPYQFRKVLGLYFTDVTLLSQDFRDSATRERARLQHRGVTVGKLAGMVRPLVPGFLRRALRPFARKAIVGKGFELSDLVFADEPGEEQLNRSFGIMAICRSPR